MSLGWAELAWRSLPVLLVLAWFLALIGGFSAGGLVHLLLLAAVVVFGYQVVSDRSP
ncbi:MAG: lmo0937 family membrane protein [Chloroflexota bacterium]|nr:lmo0937 family membrane protein [Chloroflexota bacterium]